MSADALRVRPDGDPAYASFLQGRSIVAVGPAATLIGRKLGTFIDSFDIVVRFNEAFDLVSADSALAGDIGTRTDVLYCNQVVLRKHIAELGPKGRAGFTRRCERLGVRYVNCTNNSLSFTPSGDPAASCPAADRRVLADVSGILAAAGLPTEVRVVSAASRVLHSWLAGHWGRTGYIALFDLLMFEPSRLHATGMTLYHGGGHLLAPGADLHPLKNRDGSWAVSPSGEGHDSYLERETMRWLVRCFRRTLTVDGDLSALLGYTTGSDLAQPNSPHRAVRTPRSQPDR